jgi:hypothetical protein
VSYAAIFEVTQALRKLLRAEVTRLSGATASVTLLPPGDELPEVLGVNLYLYRVTECPYMRNRDWPGDRMTPPSHRPALGLQLFYLLTALGPKPEPESTEGDHAHSMLGMSMLTLHEHPILNDVHLPDFDADIELPLFLQNSYEKVKICLMPVNQEELSNIWSTINQPYRLSVAYEVSLVELTPTAPPPVGGGTVMVTRVDVTTLEPPRLMELAPTSGALARISGGAITPNDLRINGFGLSFPGQTPIVRVGGQLAAIKRPPAPTDQTVTVTLPADLDAGPQIDVRVTLNRRTSTPLLFTVDPWLTSLMPIRTTLETDATVTLQGSGFTNPQAVRLDGPGGTTNVTTFEPGGSATQAVVKIPATLANGLYNVRLVRTDASATNPRVLEVIPRLDQATAVVTGAVHQITIDGARLNGSDVRLILDGATYQTGANASAAQLVFTLGRQLNAGPHRIALNVDGQLSHTIELEV